MCGAGENYLIKRRSGRTSLSSMIRELAKMLNAKLETHTSLFGTPGMALEGKFQSNTENGNGE